MQHTVVTKSMYVFMDNVDKYDIRRHVWGS